MLDDHQRIAVATVEDFSMLIPGDFVGIRNDAGRTAGSGP
jgi:hypothetical protein